MCIIRYIVHAQCGTHVYTTISRALVFAAAYSLSLAVDSAPVNDDRDCEIVCWEVMIIAVNRDAVCWELIAQSLHLVLTTKGILENSLN